MNKTVLTVENVKGQECQESTISLDDWLLFSTQSCKSMSPVTVTLCALQHLRSEDLKEHYELR